MNKKLLILGGGIFSVLLATLAVLSASLDQSTFEQDSSQFLGIHQQQQMVSLTPAGSVPIAALSLVTNSKLNMTKLSAAIQQVTSQVINPTTPRLESYITTDKAVYRAGDVVFIDVLVFDAFTKTPVLSQQPLNNTNQTSISQFNASQIQIQVQILDESGYQIVDNSTYVANLTNATAGFAISLLPLDQIYSGNYVIRASSMNVATSTKIIQVRDSPDQPQPQVIVPPQCIATIELFGDNFTTETTFYGKITVTTASGQSVNNGYVNTFYNINNYIDYYYNMTTPLNAYGVSYISYLMTDLLYQYSISPLQIVAQVQVGSLSCQAQLDNIKFNQTVNATTQQQQSNIDPAKVSVVFSTENSGDLVVNATQKVYFQSSVLIYNPSIHDVSPTFFNFSNGQIRAYNALNQSAPIINISSGISTSFNGLGVFSYKHLPNIIPFLEITIANTISQSQPQSSQNLNQGTNFFGNGLIRIPLMVDSISSRKNQVNALEAQNALNAQFGGFNVAQLQNFQFSTVDNVTGLVYGFSQGFFTVGLPNQPPLLVFNSFPNANNFNNTIGFVYNYTQGLLNGTNQINFDPSGMTVTQTFFSISQIASNFLDYTINGLSRQYNYNGFNLLNLTLGNDNYNLQILQNLFQQIPGIPLLSGQFFGPYGPIPMNQSQQQPSNQTNTTGNSMAPEVTFSLTKKILASTDVLEVAFSTNMNMNPNDVYYFQIKQKERILFSTGYQFNQNEVQTKQQIPASSFNIINGGILTANLYKVQNSYFRYQNLTANATNFCDPVNPPTGPVINSSDPNQGNTPFNASNITAPKPCILTNFDQVVSFLDIRGSIQFFKKPTNNLKVSINLPKVNYATGEQVNATIIVTNVTSGKPVTDGYLYVSVTEDVQLQGFDSDINSIAGRVYLGNDVDSEQFYFLDPQSLADQWFGVTNNQSNDFNLELFLATQGHRYHYFEVSSFQIMSRGPSQAEYSSLFPTDFDNLDQVYAYPFNNDFRDYLFNNMSSLLSSGLYNNSALNNAEKNWIQDYQNFKYQRPAPMNNYMAGIINPTTKMWAHDVPPNYNRSAALDQSDTLFFASGARVVNGQFNVSFKLSDLQTKFRISANSYGTPGAVAFTSAVIQTLNPFSFNFNLPQQMIQGDTYTVTLNISNFNPQNLTVQPTVVSSDPSLAVNFNYTVLQNISGVMTNVTFQNFNVSGNVSSFIRTFQVTALRSVQNAQLTIGLAANTNDSISKYSVQQQQQTSVFDQGIRRSIYSQGEVATQQQQTQVPGQINLSVMLPSQDTINTTRGFVSIYPSYFSQVYDVSNNMLQSTSVGTLEDIVTKIGVLSLLIAQFEQIQSTDPVMIAQYNDTIIKAKKLYQQLQQYQIYLNGKPAGYDYFPYSNVTGNIPLTAFILFTLSGIPSLDDFFSSNTTIFQQNLKWILSKRDGKGNFTLSTTDLDANGRAPTLTTNAFTLYIAKNLATFPLTANLTIEYNAMINTTNSSFNPNQTGFSNLTSDPNLLAWTIWVMGGDLDQMNTAYAFAQQLLKHQNAQGYFDVSRPNTSYTIFNSIGKDRIVEVTAISVIALSILDPNQFSNQINLATSWLKQQNINGLGLGNMATFFSLAALSFNPRQTVINSTVNLTIALNGQVFDQAQFQSQLDTIKFIVDNSNGLLTNVSQANFTVSVAGTNIPDQSAYGLSNDQIFGYSSVFSFVDNTYKGDIPVSASLNLTVTPTYTNGSLGTSKINTTLSYTVALTNLDTVRGQSITKVTIRPSSCLTLDMVSFKSLVGVSSTIQSYEINNNTYEIYAYIRNLKAAEVKSFQLNFLQTSQGLCKLRPFTAQNMQGGGLIVSSTPKF